MYRLLVLSVVCVLTLASPVKREAGDNPCTPAALAAETTYFAVADNDTTFIECDLLGNANVIACPNDLVWDQSRLSCVYRFSVAGSGTGTSTGTGSGTSTGTGSGTSTGTDSGTDSGTGSGTDSGKVTNPCNKENIAAGKMFFPDEDPTKFIQCDLWGNSLVVSCPDGLVWNKYSDTCASTAISLGK